MEPRFVLDAMLGRLARWLRLMGYDSLYDASWDDAFLVRLARAESRELLTRDRGLAAHRGVQVLFITSENLAEQWRQLQRTFGLVATAAGNRCPVCNNLLQPVSKDLVCDLVPPYVYRTQTVFQRCPHCWRIYWRGTHWTHVQETISRWSQDEIVAARPAVV